MPYNKAAAIIVRVGYIISKEVLRHFISSHTRNHTDDDTHGQNKVDEAASPTSVS